MSSAGFDTLRLWHPAQTNLVDRLQAYVHELARTSHAVIDERIVSATLGVPRDSMEPFLVELVKVQVLTLEYFWICNHTGSTVWNGTDLTTVPSWVRCEECDDLHFYSEQQIEVHFIASASFSAELRGSIGET